MTSGSRKRGLDDHSPSAVVNGTAKIRKEDEQVLRETEPFSSIDDVTSELSSIEGYVGGAKGDVFQKILKKLGKSDVLFRKKQGQDIAAEPELRFLYKEDVTEMRRLINEHVAKSGRADFEAQLQKMGSEDRLIKKKMNHRQNSNREPDDVDIPQRQAFVQNSNRDEVVEVDRTRFVGIDPPKEEQVDISVHEMEMDEVPQLVEPVPKIEPVEEDEHHNDPDVDEDAEQLQPSTPMSVQQLDREGDDDPQSKPIEPKEDPDEVIDLSDSASDGDMMEKDNEDPEKSESDEPTEGPEEEPKMSPEDFLSRFDRLSYSELIQIILNQCELRKCACVVLKLKNCSLNRFVEEPDHTVTLSVQGEGDIHVGLDEGSDYVYKLVLLIHTVLNGFRCSRAVFEFKAQDYGTVLPFEKIFQFKLLKFKIGELRMNKPEMTHLFHYVNPVKFYVSFPSSHLFDNDGTLLISKLNYLELSSDEVDQVDKLIENCSVSHIQLAPNSYWSDESVRKVLGTCEKSLFNWSMRRIVCHYASDNNVKPHQKTITQWRQLFDNREGYRRRIQMNDNSSKQTITLDSKFRG